MLTDRRETEDEKGLDSLAMPEDPSQARMRRVAEEIFGVENPGAVQRWVDYWRQCKTRSRSLVEAFLPLVLFDLEGKRVLDIGCGTGALGEWIGPQSRLYVGGDSHFHVLQFAESSSGRRYVQCSGVELPFRSATFDYVFAFDVLEHVEGGLGAQIGFLSELHRVIKPTGMIFLTTPNRLYPFDGHTEMYFPQYLPTRLADAYVRRVNPTFLREHRSFSEIVSLTPGAFQSCLRKSGLAFLHELPCALDRRDYLKQYPLRGLSGYLGLGWYPHAEFWGILVRREMRDRLRLKLRKNWFYELNQPGSAPPAEFGPGINFDEGTLGHQLGTGWFWHERDRRGYRWTGKEAECFVQTAGPAHYLNVHGYSPYRNALEFKVEGVEVGEIRLEPGEDFRSSFLIPFESDQETIWKVGISCGSTSRETAGEEPRELGVMIFSVSLTERYGG